MKLLNSFNMILMMDNTYKTNKNKMSLLEIVGATSIGMTFFVAFVLLPCERENNFVWAFVKGLFFRFDSYFRVLVCLYECNKGFVS